MRISLSLCVYVVPSRSLDFHRHQVTVTFDGGERTVDEAATLPMCVAASQGVPDMMTLDILHEASILHNLHQRQQNDEYYTMVGSILVSMNPFKPLDIYGKDSLQKYSDASLEQLLKLPAHIFTVANRAYTSMRKDRKSSSIVISGESGAGKTEATKLVLKYLTNASGKSGTGISPLERIILESNPVLEAFGNAKTVRNNNSSRFGKYFDVKFDAKGSIVGGTITNYLLEKSRVVFVAENERNYHIFYQICAGATPEERERYSLKPASEFNYTAMSGTTEIPGVDDKKEYEDMSNALFTVGFTDSEQDAIKSVVAAILHLGNIEFEAKGDDASDVKNKEPLKIAAGLLGVDEIELESALVVRTMSTGRRTSVYKISLNPVDAANNRDALCKAMYDRVFNWLVERISGNMEPTEKVASSIGVLDIFGFEVMPLNSFEQLCINFANEKLHQQFVNYVFKLDMDEYKKESLDISVPFKDNMGCVETIEKKGIGMLPLLQEQVQLGQRGSDAAWLEKMGQQFPKGHEYYEPKRLSRTVFTVKHYAGPVDYESTGFLEKNKDSMSQDLNDVMNSTQNVELKSVFADKAAAAASGGAGKRSVATIASKFVSQLSSLVTVLSSRSLHYIRCIKPTETKQPMIFDGAMVRRQLSYSGVLETIEVRKIGYAVRMPFDEFVGRYALLLEQTASAGTKKLEGGDGARFVLENVGSVNSESYRLGTSKVFLKNESVLYDLDRRREDALVKYVVKIQCCFRRKLAIVKLERLREEKRKREEEERKRREEEERRRKEEEERRRREEEERARLAEEERKKLEEEEAKQKAAHADKAKREEQQAAADKAAKAAADAESKAAENAAQNFLVETAATAVRRLSLVDGSATDPKSAAARARAGSRAVKEPVQCPTDSPIGLQKIEEEQDDGDGVPDEIIHKKGWLAKEGSKGVSIGFLHNWQRRFIDLNNGEISYYTNDDMFEFKGSIMLDKDSSVGYLKADEARRMPTDKAIGQFFFVIKAAEGKVQRVSADSDRERREWMSAIEMAIKQIQKKEGCLPYQGKPCNVYFPDRSSCKMRIFDDSVAKNIFMKIIEHVGVSQGLQFFALVEETRPVGGKPMFRVLSESEKLIETTKNENSRLVFKKVVFVDRTGVPTIDQDNPVVLNFQYCQAVTDSLAYYHAPEETALRMAALQLKVQGRKIVPAELKENLHEYLPYWMMSSERSVEEADKWIAGIFDHVKSMDSGYSTSAEQCKVEYIKLSQNSPIYGSSFYQVQLQDDKHTMHDYVLAVNQSGIHLLEAVGCALKCSFLYSHIVKWGRSTTSFNLIHGENDWKFYTKQGEEINKFMGIYVRMLVERRARERKAAAQALKEKEESQK